jgi:hypothetical protein
VPEKTYPSGLIPEFLKREIERLESEQEREIDHAIYLGLTPEKAERLETRRALIKALRDELYGPDGLGPPLPAARR